MDEDVWRFLRSLVDPEKYGHAVTEEVRNEARKLLGISTVPIRNHDSTRTTH